MGNELQSLAACQHLPAAPAVRVDRDMIHRRPGADLVLWPPSSWC